MIESNQIILNTKEYEDTLKKDIEELPAPDIINISEIMEEK